MQIRISASAEANVDTRFRAAMIAHARECYVMSGGIDGRASREERLGMILKDRPAVREARKAAESAQAGLERARDAMDAHRDREPTGVTAKFTGRHSKWEAALRDLEAVAEKAEGKLGKAKESLRVVEDRHRPGAEREAMENRRENTTDRRRAADWRRAGDALSSGDPAFAEKINRLIDPARSPENGLRAIRPDKLLAAARDWEPPVAKANPATLQALATFDFEAPKGYGR